LGYKKVENRISKKTIFLKEMYIFSGRHFQGDFFPRCQKAEEEEEVQLLLWGFFYSEKFRVSRRRKILLFSELFSSNL